MINLPVHELSATISIDCNPTTDHDVSLSQTVELFAYWLQKFPCNGPDQGIGTWVCSLFQLQQEYPSIWRRKQNDHNTSVSAVLDSCKSSKRGRSNREAFINTAHWSSLLCGFIGSFRISLFLFLCCMSGSSHIPLEPDWRGDDQEALCYVRSYHHSFSIWHNHYMGLIFKPNVQLFITLDHHLGLKVDQCDRIFALWTCKNQAGYMNCSPFLFASSKSLGKDLMPDFFALDKAWAAMCRAKESGVKALPN